MRKILIALALLAGFALLPSDSSAQTTQRIRFAKGATSKSIKGIVKGYGYVDYIIGIGDRQVLTVKLSGSPNAEFVLFDPDGENVPDAAGIREIVSQMDVPGDYKVRVLMPRAAARRKGASAAFSLFVKVVDIQQ